MKCQHARSLAFASLLLSIAGCGGPDSGTAPSSTDASSAPGAAQPQPPDGVPAGTSPLPLPEPGKAYNNPQPRSNIEDGGTLTLPIGELGPNLNLFSVDGTTVFVKSITSWLIPQLWDYGITGGATPNPDFLASVEIVSTEPETVRFTVNPNAKWNDGTPIDWTAFETTWKTQSGADPRFNPGSSDGYKSIAGVAKGEKDNEVIVTFKEPFYPIENVFAQLEHPKNADPDFYKTGWVNKMPAELMAGPFTVESLTEDRLVLVRNPKWWGDPPKLDTVVYRQMDDVASVNAFQNGEVDTTTITGGRQTADTLKQIGGMKDAQIRRGFATSTSIYELGNESELFKDAAARKAFVLCIDRRLLTQIRYQGMDWREEAPGSGLIYTWQQGYRNNMADVRYDPAQARAVLDAAGWAMGADGFRYKNGTLAEFRYVTFGDEPVFIAMARAEQKMAQDIGLKMNVEVRKTTEFSKTLTQGTFDVVAMSWQADSPFGYAFAWQIYGTTSESNFSRVGSAHVDALLGSVVTIRDSAEALRTFNDAEREALGLYGLFPTMNGPSQYAVKKGLANFGPSGFLVPNPEDVGWQKDSPQ
ncbi:MAG TPA: ABC transporter family substrate-binding protein [Gammaproteobacteria bacterium]|nr:ABC transporter family substrate-binding protein [Gammaproteobacteria bacterium]